MSQILIRGLDEELVAKLKARAKRNGRSLEGEARTILESAAGASVAQSREILRKWQKAFAGHRFSNSTDLIREDRQR
jgi:plasmid stability protein